MTYSTLRMSGPGSKPAVISALTSGLLCLGKPLDIVINVSCAPPRWRNSALSEGKHKEDCMKKLVALAALGVALAAIPMSAAMKRTGVTAGLDQALAQAAPCYKGEALGPCPKPKPAPTGR
jgi:hypothetical protein